jgi:hypothetical protein
VTDAVRRVLCAQMRPDEPDAEAAAAAGAPGAGAGAAAAAAAASVQSRVRRAVARHRVLLAGALAGLCLLAVPSGERTSISLFFAVHALEVGVKWLVRSARLPYLTDHGDVAVMCAASMVIIWAWFNARTCHDPSYLNFLDSFGNHP